MTSGMTSSARLGLYGADVGIYRCVSDNRDVMNVMHGVLRTTEGTIHVIRVFDVRYKRLLACQSTGFEEL